MVQLPICDGRPFSPSPRLPAPDWPSPSIEFPTQFIRSFGRVARRRRGADAAWADEFAFCKAHRAVRIDGLKSTRILGDLADRRRPATCAFRRLFVSEHSSVRFEVGFSLPISRDAEASGQDVARLINAVALMPVRVTGGSAGPLVMQGRSLARLYERSTQSHSEAKRAPNLVQTGMPMVLVESPADEPVLLPDFLQRLEPSPMDGVEVGFSYLELGGGVVPAWFLEAPAEGKEAIRGMRISLLRLHAEREALSGILRMLKRKDLPYVAGEDEADALERYLRDASRLLEATKWQGVASTSVVAALSAGRVVEDRSEVTVLRERLEDARKQILRKALAVERAHGAVRETAVVKIEANQGTVNIEELTVTMSDQSIRDSTITDSVVNQVVADRIENSFNAAKGQVNAELGAALDTLSTEIKALLADMAKGGVGDQSQVADAAEILTQQAAKEKPLKEVLVAAGKSIVEAASAVAARVEPVTSAVGRVLKFFGLGIP
jgi:hypothetical protein